MTSVINLTFLAIVALFQVPVKAQKSLPLVDLNQITFEDVQNIGPIKSVNILLDGIAADSDVEKQEEELEKLVEESQVNNAYVSPPLPSFEAKAIRSPSPTTLQPFISLTSIKVSQIKQQLRTIIFDDRIAHVVRIIFHDCVGGCDGCLNRNLPPNMTPMLDTLNLLDILYDSQGYSSWLSRADFYALAGITAVEIGVENANVGCFAFNCIRKPRIHFRFGRQDCPTSPFSSESRAFPEGRDDYDAVMNFFALEFGLTPRFATALLGAHTLGGASGASGFIGFWKENAVEAAKFDQRYYSLLVSQKVYWTHVDVANQTNATSPRFQWEGFRNNQQVSFMLNSDVCLLLDIQTNNVGQSSCNFNTCPYSPTALLVHIYARFPNFWIRDFGRAFTRMIENGSPGLIPV